MSNFNFNKVILGGRLTSDPELRQTNTGIPVTSFSIAVNRRFASKNADSQQNAQNVDFINVVAWRERAEFVTRYFRKGSSICIVGSIQTRSYTDQQGNKRTATDVVADEINFVDSKAENGAPDSGYSRYATDTGSSNSSADIGSDSLTVPKFEEISNDDDLPF